MTQTTAIAPATPTSSAATLTAVDRCDRCGAQAYVRFENPSIVLDTGVATFMACAHHARFHGPALAAKGFIAVIDETAKLQDGNRQQGADHA